VDRCGQSSEPDRTPVKLLDDRKKKFAVDLIETERIDLHAVESIMSDL